MFDVMINSLAEAKILFINYEQVTFKNMECFDKFKYANRYWQDLTYEIV